MDDYVLTACRGGRRSGRAKTRQPIMLESSQKRMPAADQQNSAAGLLATESMAGESSATRTAFIGHTAGQPSGPTRTDAVHRLQRCCLSQQCHAAAQQFRSVTMVLAALVLAFLMFPLTAAAAPPGTVEGSTYDEAVRSIPFDRMTDEAQGKLWKIISQPSLYRRLPVTRVQADPDLYVFLVRYPEVVVNMWELMGVTKVKIRRTSDYAFEASDGAGTSSQVELIYGDKETHVMLAEGTYEGSLFKRLVHGRCVLLLRSGYSDTAENNSQITHQLDIFVQLDNVGAELIAKTLHPLVGQTADHNFVEATRFLGQVSQAAATRPTGMQQLAGKLTKVEPTVRQSFASISAAVYQRATANLIPVKRVEE